MLTRGADDGVAEQLCPEPEHCADADAAVVREALAKGEQHLVLVIVAELAGVEAEQDPVQPLAEGEARHGYDLRGTRPESRACVSSDFKRSASANATRRPNLVIR